MKALITTKWVLVALCAFLAAIPAVPFLLIAYSVNPSSTRRFLRHIAEDTQFGAVVDSAQGRPTVDGSVWIVAAVVVLLFMLYAQSMLEVVADES